MTVHQHKVGDKVTILDVRDPIHYLAPHSTATVVAPIDGGYDVKGVSRITGRELGQYVQFDEVAAVPHPVLDPSKPEDAQAIRDLPDGAVILLGTEPDSKAAQVTRFRFGEWEDESVHALNVAGSDLWVDMDELEAQVPRPVRVIYVPGKQD